MPPLRTLIIGCGRIAGGFDTLRGASEPPLTHAGAYRRHGGFALAACVDPDPEARAAFVQRWGVAAGFGDVAAAATAGPFDVVSVCSPTALHDEHLEQVLALRPRLVFCEKPVTASAAQTAAIVQRCAAAGVLLAVNHTRRWSADLQALADDLAAGAWGAVRSVVGTYNKGVLNNGSHLVDLLHLLLGPLDTAGAPDTLDVLHAGPPLFDHAPGDPSVPALLRAGAGGATVHLAATHAADGALFELQLHTERGVVAIEDGGRHIRRRRYAPSADFAGYRVLDAGSCDATDLLHATTAAVHNIAAALGTGAPLRCTGQHALAAQRVCEALHRVSTQGAAAPVRHATDDLSA